MVMDDVPRVTRRTAAGAAMAGALTSGCSTDGEAAPTPSSPSPSPEATPAPATTQPPTSEAPEAGSVRPDDFVVRIALRVVDRLAAGIGPRHATSAAYDEAARWVAGELTALGYVVRRQRVRVPGGDSWGVLVDAGTSTNVIARLPGTDLARPHLVVGAHLDTVPQAPGAEDNASGVGVLLATAAAVAEAGTRLPVVLVAFGAEEPRGPSDADHHYGSRQYVASLSRVQRRAGRGMISLDRGGGGAAVPVGTAVEGDDPAHREVLAAAERAGVRVLPEDNRSSDHWQFVQAGLPGVRLGSTPYAAYHSPADTPDVIQRDQLARTGRIVLAWLA